MKIYYIFTMLVVLGSAAYAQEDDDLKFIPATSPKATSSTDLKNDSKSKYNLFIDETGSVFSNRMGLTAPAPITIVNSQSISAIDFKYNYYASPNLNFVWSERFNFYVEDDFNFPTQNSFRDNWREGYVSYEPIQHFFFNLGRVNVRNGVALGYNPTDFLKTRSLISQASVDPTALRQNRLGTIMARSEIVGDNESVSFSFIPAIQSITSINPTPPSTFDPQLGRTNSQVKFLATIESRRFDTSPELLIFNDDIGAHFGANISQTLGKSFVFYTEWSSVNSTNISTRALAFGQNTGTLPSNATPIPQTDNSSRFNNDLSTGFSWTSESKYTINLEYHFHQSGLTQTDFNNWNSLAQSNSLYQNQLWYVRQYASDQQEPLMQNEFFFRFDFPDFILPRHNFDVIAFINPGDGSTQSQISSEYLWSDNLSVGGIFTMFAGGNSTLYGSMPIANGFSAKLKYFF